jgi:pantoate--beta-alanine ligase
VNTITAVRSAVAAARSQGRTIGFVPTMGALHAGHAALVQAARRGTGFVVVSIFVNPTQFGPTEDLDRYPRTLDSDREICARAGADLIFAPAVAEIYPEPSLTRIAMTDLDDRMEGAVRPGHFDGVRLVVLKLFHIVQPDVSYFGQKDAQQARIVRQMVRDLNVPVVIRVEPTVREPDGLAMSSRNRYLSPAGRAAAPGIYRALSALRDRFQAGERQTDRLLDSARSDLESIPGARVDYIEVVDADTLQPIPVVDRPALAAVAVHLGATRLIDNIPLP